VLRITVPQKQKCDASVFAVCQMPEFPWATRKLCFLILCAEDVDPDKGLRRHHGLGIDLEVRGFVKGAPRCFQVLPQFGMRGCVYAIFSRCNFFIKLLHKGCILVVRTEMQYVLYQRKIELRTRSMSHLLSSVDPVLYCDSALRHQRANSRADCFIACFIGCFSVCFLLRLGHCGLCAASSCFTERCIHCLCTTQLRCCSLHSSCFTPCFDLINYGEQCN
jgi:hypothetical protein